MGRAAAGASSISCASGPVLPRQPGDSCVVDPEGFGDLAAALTGFEPLDGFLLLMVVELGFAAELLALLDGGDTPLIGALEDAVR